MENILIDFGNKIKTLRKKKKLSQKQFAEITGLHYNYLGMIERGERNPSLKNIEIIAKGFEISISDLMKF